MREFLLIDYVQAVRAADITTGKGDPAPGIVKAVLVWIASYASAYTDEEKGMRAGEARPSLDTLADRSGFSRASICRSIEILIAQGFLTRRRTGRQAVNRYYVRLPDMTSLPATSLPATSPTATSPTDMGDVSHSDVGTSPTATGSVKRSAKGSDLLVLTPEPTNGTTKAKGRKAPKHTPEEVTNQLAVLNHFCTRFEQTKGVKPKSLGSADAVAAFKLAGTYGTTEACSIIDRAFEDKFVIGCNCTLRFIASKADTYRGAAPAPKSNGHVVQPVGEGGRAWRVGK